MQRYEWYGFLFGAVAVIAFIVAGFLYLKSKPSRMGDVRLTKSSPQGKFDAAVYVKKSDVGEADSFTLRLKPAGKEFAADSKVFTVAQGCEISSVAWKSNSALSVNYVSYGADACNVKLSYHWRGVTIKTVSQNAVKSSTPTVAAREKK